MVLPLSASPSARPIVRAGLWAVDVALADLHPGAGRVHEVHPVEPGAAAGTQIREVIVRSGGVSIHAAQQIARADAAVFEKPPRLVVDIHLRTNDGAAGGAAARDAPPTPAASKKTPSPGRAAAGLEIDGPPRFGVEGDRYRTVLALPAVPARPPAVHASLWAVDVELPGVDAKRAAAHVPKPKSPTARGIREVVVRPGGVSVKLEQPVGSARAFFLSRPPRLVLDLHPAPSVAVALASGGAAAAGATRSARNTEKAKTTETAETTDGAAAAGAALAKRDTAEPPATGALMVLATKEAESTAANAVPDEAAVVAPPAPTSAPEPAGAASVTAPAGASSADRMAALARSAAMELAALAGDPTPAMPTPAQAGTDPASGDAAVEHAGHAAPAVESAGESGDATGANGAVEVGGIEILPAQRQQGQQGQETQAAARSAYRLEEFRGHGMIWPELGAPIYSHADTAAATEKFLAPRRAALEALRQTRDQAAIVTEANKRVAVPARAVLPPDAPAAAHLLEADIVYLHALGGRTDPFTAVALYRRAARVAPRFPDRDRARLMVGFAELAAGLIPEAEGDFLQLARATDDPGVGALALLGAGRAARAAGHDERAARLLRGAIALGPAAGHGSCHARGGLGSLLAESGRGMQALEVFEEMRARCPADIVRSPRMLLTHAAALAAAGQAKAAEELLLALPELDGELFARRKFLEADLAMATGAPDFARRAYELVRTETMLPLMVRGEATLRLARVEDELGRSQEARDLLRELGAQAGRAGRVSLVARAQALEAELLAAHGHQPEALALLARTDALGPAGLAAAEGARRRIFPAWIENLRARGDHAGMLTVFYRYRGDGVGRHLAPAQVVQIADAALEVGVPDLGMRILTPVHAQLRGQARADARRILAQAALAKGEHAQAEQLATEASRAAKSPEARAEAQRLRAEALLQLGRVEDAARLLADGRDTAKLLALAAGARGQGGGDAAKAIEALEGALGTPTGSAAAEPAGDARSGEVENLLALAAAAERAGEHTLAATALRAALRLAPQKAGAGVRYQLAQVEAASASPAAAAASYADAATKETDPLLARAAAASAAYYRIVGALDADAPGRSGERR
jgi:hypothetical protein